MEQTTAVEYKWDTSMKTGSPEVDQQHMELIRQLNLLLHALEQGAGEQQVDELLNFLSTYVVEHFKFEEELMDRNRCPIAQANKNAHVEFINKLKAFRAQVESQSASKTVVAIQVLRELSNWLINHIRKIDAQLQNQLP